MSFADYVLQKSLHTQGITHELWEAIRWLLVRNFNDPPCSIRINGHLLNLPLSHELPTYLNMLPFYDTLPMRLSEFLHNRYGPIQCLDVGANIGDTLVSLYRGEQDRFLAIEPDPKFNGYLHKNWNVPNVRILSQVCSSESRMAGYKINEKFGTASFFENPQGKEMQTVTIDNLLTTYPEIHHPTLIKVDTDGGDFAVISGARRALVGQPAVLFECDVFGNGHYVEDCLETLGIFEAAGYRSFLLYEKFGYIMGYYDLDDLVHFKELLFFQLTKKFVYFDILLMKELDLRAFYKIERNYFLDTLHDRSLRSTAGIL
jgi:FkbM family methyltransferase